MPIRPASWLLAALLLGGCVVPAYTTFTRSFTISGGQTLEFAFSGGGIVPAENNDVKIGLASFQFNSPPKTIVYTFTFTSKTGRAPRSVVVEDVSGAKSEILIEDDHPVLGGKDGRLWARDSGTKTRPDPRLDWLDEPDESFRIYRFTIVTVPRDGLPGLLQDLSQEATRRDG